MVARSVSEMFPSPSTSAFFAAVSEIFVLSSRWIASVVRSVMSTLPFSSTSPGRSAFPGVPVEVGDTVGDVVGVTVGEAVGEAAGSEGCAVGDGDTA